MAIGTNRISETGRIAMSMQNATMLNIIFKIPDPMAKNSLKNMNKIIRLNNRPIGSLLDRFS